MAREFNYGKVKPAGTEPFILDGDLPRGNDRGQSAVDLQLARAMDDEVASGQYAVILGGYGNRCNQILAMASGIWASPWAATMQSAAGYGFYDPNAGRTMPGSGQRSVVSLYFGEGGYWSSYNELLVQNSDYLLIPENKTIEWRLTLVAAYMGDNGAESFQAKGIIRRIGSGDIIAVGGVYFYFTSMGTWTSTNYGNSFVPHLYSTTYQDYLYVYNDNMYGALRFYMLQYNYPTVRMHGKVSMVEVEATPAAGS